MIDGRLEPGQRLKEEELARELGISRTPVREALLVLQTEGLRGVRAESRRDGAQFEADDLDDLYQLRAVLEGFAARRAAARITASGPGAALRRATCGSSALRAPTSRRPRPGERPLPPHASSSGRKRAPDAAGAGRDPAPARLPLVLLVLARPEADLGALPPPADRGARGPRRRAGRARDEGARARGPGLPGRAAAQSATPRRRDEGLPRPPRRAAGESAAPARSRVSAIVELGQLLAGPFTGRLLGDLGAEVIKVEPPGQPDPIREWGKARYGVGRCGGRSSRATRSA